MKVSTVGTRQLQPGTVTYSTRQLPSQHNGTLQPVPPAISIMNKVWLYMSLICLYFAIR